MTAAGKFRAPALGVKNYIAKLAEQQHLPKNTRSGKDWSCFQAVSRAVRDKIQAHQEELARKLLSADLDSGLAATADDPLELRHWTSNVAQQPHFMGPVRGNVPAMLQHTNLWIFGKRRLALPMEHLEIQGWNILNIWKCRQPISVKHLRSCQQHAGFPLKILRRKRNALPSGWCSHCFSIGCNRRCYSMKEKQPDLEHCEQRIIHRSPACERIMHRRSDQDREAHRMAWCSVSLFISALMVFLFLCLVTPPIWLQNSIVFSPQNAWKDLDKVRCTVQVPVSSSEQICFCL